MNEKVKWYGDGIYSRPRADRDGKSYEQFYVRVFAEGRSRYFRAGRTEASAKRLRLRILSDTTQAVAKHQRERQDAREGYTVAQLYKAFTAGYRGRGQTDYCI